MAITDIDICNRALVSLGEGVISSLTADGTDKSLACATLYEGIKHMVLSMRAWRFSMYKVQLARLVDTPANEWNYAYQLPPDMLAGPRAVFTSTNTGELPMTDFEIFGDKLFTDHTVIVIDYQADVNENKMPRWFVQLLAMALAGFMGKLVTDSASLAQDFLQRAFGTPSEQMRGGYFAICAQIDAAANPPNTITDNSIVIARFS